MMVGRIFLVLTGACQFGHGVGGFTTNSIHSDVPGPCTLHRAPVVSLLAHTKFLTSKVRQYAYVNPAG